MPPFEKELSMKNTRELAETFSRIGDSGAMRQFFDEIFTPAERNDLVLRWELMKMLAQGKPQRAIAAELGVSLCKITRGAKIVHNPKSITNQLLNRSIIIKEKTS
jgi:TrpR family trp operon transcriptional repressor